MNRDSITPRFFELRPLLALAPMQSITHLPFMRVMQRFGGPDYYVTEYFRVYPDYSLSPHILESITKNETGRPMYAQLIGYDIPSLVRISKELLQYPVAGIDLNLGCPAPVVCRKNAGGGLLRQKNHLADILTAMREVIPQGKFSVKTRIGYDDPREFEELLALFKVSEIDLLTVHGRTVKERYQTPIHTELIRLAVQEMSCPVIANGNVVDTETAQVALSETQASGLMVGRGAIRNPWIFSQIKSVLRGEKPQPISLRRVWEYISMLYDEIAQREQPFDEVKHINHMKKYLVYIAQGLDPEFEREIRRVKTSKAFKQVCRHFLDHSQKLPSRPCGNTKLFCGFESLRFNKENSNHIQNPSSS